jgi:hypothetical protein
MSIVCFIHSCNMGVRGTSILEQEINYLKAAGLFDKFEHLFINNIGIPLGEIEGAVVTNYSTDTGFFENCTLRQLYFFAQWHPEYKILYLHTKGVSHHENHVFAPGISDWIRFMMYCTVFHHEACIKILDHVDVVGCDFRHHMFYQNPDHYSGNFWWANAKYINSLSVMDLRTKYDAEFWLFKNNPVYANIHTCPYGHYENRYIESQYTDIVNDRSKNILYNHQNIKNLPILYGVTDKYIDITDICHQKLCANGIMRIPAGDQIRNELFTDPVPCVIKHIKIGDVSYDYSVDACFRLSLPKIALVTYTDIKYYPRAQKTINDIRTKGQFTGPIVVMTDGLFKIDNEYITKMNLTIKEYPDIDISSLLEYIKQHPFNNSDGREFTKTKQWNKLYVFDEYFKQWDYIFFVDAGLRIFDKISYFYPQFNANSITALDDGHPEFVKKFHTQIELSNIPVVEKLKEIYDINSSYFLNCMFIFDTTLIEPDTLQNMIEMMNEYPICKTNEMAIMNIYFRKNWTPLNIKMNDGRILFDWSEREGRQWNHYVALKYPGTYYN